MRYINIFFLLIIPLLIAGCSSRISSFLSEPLSENYALAAYGAEASHPELNDGNLKTWGITRPPKRVYTIVFPEEKQIDRVVIYSGNVLGYQLFCWNSDLGKWKIIGDMDSIVGSQQVRAEQSQLRVPRFVHRVKCKTSKLKLQVIKAKSDGIVTTRSPGKNVKILNHRVDYIGVGRRRVRVDLYDIFKQGSAMIREIEAYSHVEKAKTEPD